MPKLYRNPDTRSYYTITRIKGQFVTLQIHRLGVELLRENGVYEYNDIPRDLLSILWDRGHLYTRGEHPNVVGNGATMVTKPLPLFDSAPAPNRSGTAQQQSLRSEIPPRIDPLTWSDPYRRRINAGIDVPVEEAHRSMVGSKDCIADAGDNWPTPPIAEDYPVVVSARNAKLVILIMIVIVLIFIFQ